MEIKYKSSDLNHLCKEAIDSFFETKEEEIYETTIKGLPFSVLYEKKKRKIIGKLDNELLLLLFKSMPFIIKSGYFCLKKCVKKEWPASDEKEVIFKDNCYLVENDKKACLVIKIPSEFEKLAIESHKPEPEVEGAIYYKIDSPLITVELIEQKVATELLIMSDYGFGLGENCLTPRKHFLSFLDSQIKIDKTSNFYSSIQTAYNRIFEIDKYTKEDLYTIDKKRFVRRTLELVIEKQDSVEFEKQFANVVECISSITSCGDIMTSIVSYLHAMASLNFVKDKTMLDYTQQALGLFKAAEILFYDLLRDKCSGFYYTKKGGGIGFKDISNRSKTTLGDLSRVFYTTDSHLLQYFRDRNIGQIKGIINDWINYDRNDHLHKDIMRAKEDLMNSLSSTLKVIFELVDMFYRK